MVTETSAKGDEAVRARWLDASVAAIRELRSRGIPVLGYTWFPLFTMIDWKYRFGRRPLEDYRLDLGLYTLDGADARWRADAAGRAVPELCQRLRECHWQSGRRAESLSLKSR